MASRRIERLAGDPRSNPAKGMTSFLPRRTRAGATIPTRAYVPCEGSDAERGPEQPR